jgi:2-polyprenyl-6-methoxyphenol hydroxylase-like FAD-dependent oxidoreductase
MVRRILIVSGGVAGLALAAGLARQRLPGVRYELVERALA